MRPFQVVKDFEAALCEYTGARYAVTTNSCTMALLLALHWHVLNLPRREYMTAHNTRPLVKIPKRTYVGVPMAAWHAGAQAEFVDVDWTGEYQIKPTNVWDSARLFTSHMYRPGDMQCVSFHWSKTLGIQQGGAILHDNLEADAWLRRARFDGRAEGVPPAEDKGIIMGWHCYMSPEIAAEGLVRLSHLPMHNAPLPNSEYPDLSTLECFK